MTTYRNPYSVVCCVECGESSDACMCLDVEGDIHRRITSLEGRFQKATRRDIDSGKYNDVANLFTELVYKVGILGYHLTNFQVKGPSTPKDIQRLTVEIAALTTILGIEGDQNFQYDPTRTINEEEEP